MRFEGVDFGVAPPEAWGKLRRDLLEFELFLELALAHHHGTFQLTDEAIDAPATALAEALKAADISPDRFRVLQPGQVWEL